MPRNKMRVVLLCACTLAYASYAALVSAQRVASQQDQPDCAQGEGRLITVADAIAMTKVGYRSYSAGAPLGQIAVISPNGKELCVLLRKGNLQHNTNEYSLLFWNRDNVLSSTTPETVVTLASSSNREAIADIRWASDNETVTFLGEHPGESRQLYSFNIRRHELKKLTGYAGNITGYSLSDRGERIAFIGQARVESLWDEKARRGGVVVSKQPIPDLIAGRIGSDDDPEEDLYVQDADGGPRRMGVKGHRLGTPFLSPDAKHVVVRVRVPTSEVPEAWKHYRNRTIDAFNRFYRQRIAPLTSLFERYVLVDTATGKTRVLLDSPIWAPYTDPVWLPDSQSVVLSSVFLPNAETSAVVVRREGEQRRVTVEVNIHDGTVEKIGGHELRAAEWDRAGDRLICDVVATSTRWYGSSRSAKPLPRVYFEKIGGQWKQSQAPLPREARPELILREGMNDPPRIYVRQSGADQEKLLLDLNPQFRQLRFGNVAEVQWHWSKGQIIKGGLYFPPDYVRGKRYPLVMQTHDWSPHDFYMDGPWTTAYAAQPLAAKGILVLQVQDEYIPPEYGTTGQRDEVNKALAIYESAIEYLDRKGLIDRNRVGIIGFSHTCFYVKYALVHSKANFAAASVTEGEDGGYFQFVTNNNGFVDAYSLYGGRPFGKALRAWIQISPSFNVDRVRTPLRITTLRPDKLLDDWEWFEAMTLLGKPVDMVMMQDGAHVLQKPSERMVSQQGNADWFDFWLNGHEDPDPDKAEQYARWRELRKLHQQNEKSSPTPSPN